MDPNLFKVLGQIAGIGGISLGVLLLVFRQVIAKNVFSPLTREHSYKLLRLLIVLTFAIACIGIAAWIWSSRPVSPAQSQTWRDNYALFAARPFPKEEVTFPKADVPSITDPRIDDRAMMHIRMDDRAMMLADLNRLILYDGSVDLIAKRDRLIDLVQSAPSLNARNPQWYIIDDKIAAAYAEFKSALRSAAFKHGVDVGNVDREQFPQRNN
jgi:hypothetical protein